LIASLSNKNYFITKKTLAEKRDSLRLKNLFFIVQIFIQKELFLYKKGRISLLIGIFSLRKKGYAPN